MEQLQSCLNFFNECLSFKKKLEDFESTCEMLECEIEELDMESLKKVIGNYVHVKNELSELCHLKLCKHEFEDMDVESDDDSETDESDDDTETDESDYETEEDNEDETSEDEGKDDDKNEDEDEDDSILFKPDKCCWEKILGPFYDAIKENRAAKVMLRNSEDEMEEQYMRLDKCFETNEKNLCARLLQETCYSFDDEGYKYFKNCSSAHVKALVCCCKDKISDNVLEEMFGENYKLLIDETVPLAKKRKVFKNNENIDKLINYLKENLLPAINQYIKSKQMKYIEKYN